MTTPPRGEDRGGEGMASANRDFLVWGPYTIAILLFLVLRLAFWQCHIDSFAHVTHSQLLRSFLNGMLIDSSVAATALLAIRLVSLSMQFVSVRIARNCHTVLIGVCFGFFFFLNLADIVHYGTFDSRINIMFWQNLDQIGPIVGTVWDDYPLLPIIALWLGIMAAFFVLIRRCVSSCRALWIDRHPRLATSASVVLLVGLSFLWTPQPFWRMSSFAAGSQAASQLALNGVYTLIMGWQQKQTFEADMGKDTYEFGPLETALESARARILGANEQFLAGSYPLARRIIEPRQLAVAKPNIVIILMEGFSATYIGALSPDGRGYSPGFDSLSKAGLLFTNLYGHDTRTHHGLVSAIGSFPSTLGMILTRRRGTQSFYTLATLLKRYGYSSSFIYGFNQGFDHMGYFLKQGGVDRVIDQAEFSSPKFRARWGVSDEDLFARALEFFARQPAQNPFFSVILTSSNHSPFDIPEDFLKSHPEFIAGERPASFAYSDWALSKFLAEAAREEFFDKTIFVVLADHGEICGPRDRLLKRLHIPGLIYSPSLLPEPAVIATVGGQVDIATTLMHMIGFDQEYHFFGRNLLATPLKEGFAVMRDGHLAYYRTQDRVLIRDIRDTVADLYAVDSAGYPLIDSALNEDGLRQDMNKKLEDYLQTVHHVYSTGRHRVEDRPGYQSRYKMVPTRSSRK